MQDGLRPLGLPGRWRTQPEHDALIMRSVFGRGSVERTAVIHHEIAIERSAAAALRERVNDRSGPLRLPECGWSQLVHRPVAAQAAIERCAVERAGVVAQQRADRIATLRAI